MKQIDLPARLAKLPPQQRATLVAQLVPLSFAQERLWFLEQMVPESTAYTISQAIRLTGMLDLPSLEQSINEIVRRHEALRTIFVKLDEGNFQLLMPPQPQPLPVRDLEPPPQDQRENALQQALDQEVQQRFDLEQGPLFRAQLLRLAEDVYVLQITAHHMVFDGWSMQIFFQELSALYGTFRAGETPSLEEPALQFADYTQWQHTHFNDNVRPRLLDYWREHLDGAPALLALPTDRPRPAIQSVNGARQPITLSAELTAELRQLSRQAGTTLFMTVLAAFQVFLARITAQPDVVVGTPVAGRDRPEAEALIGFFVNTLVLRTDLSGNPSFEEVLRRVREVTLGALAHQELPFAQLVDALQPERSQSYSPLYQVMFALNTDPLPKLRLPDLRAELLPLPTTTAKVDLLLELIATQDGSLSGIVEYNSDLFDAGTIARLIGYWQTCLAALVADPAQRIAAVPLLSADERRQITDDWNTPTATRPAACLHELFEAQVERTPAAIAVSYKQRSLSYQELNQRANQVAAYLRSRGVGPDVRVGLYLERSINLIVGLLGVLKAGGAYVPLDPSYPPERVSFMLADMDAPVVLTQESLASGLSTQPASVVCLDRDWSQIAQERADNLPVVTTPENLAYVIYTSGSTGKPKGTLITHANVARLFSATEPWFQFSAQDVWTLFHSAAFDFSVWEIWGALLYGGRLVVVPYLVSRTPEAFYKLLCAEQVTVLNQTPSAFQQLMQADEDLDYRSSLSLRLVIFGGEALDLRALQPWFKRHGDQRPQLVNMYGITETTVHVTYRPVTLADLDAASRSVIGRQIPDLQLYICDQYGQLAPVGVPGEIYVGGAGLARGYLGQPALTAQRFVPHPFSRPEGTRPGERLYRSGDQGRYLPDGDIEYLGRIDHQIKLRGFRIELGEIEALLEEHPRVRTATVVLWEAAPDDQRLVAYVVPRSATQEPDASQEAGLDAQLRQHLRKQLPEYMLPSLYVLLDALPLTANGKLDRKALPAPQSGSSATSDDFAAPRDPVEQALTQLWEELTLTSPIGITDNFFEIGGNSIMALRLMSRIESLFGQDLPVAALFTEPTIEHLAKIIRAETIRAQLSSVAELQPKGSKRPIFFVHANANILCYLELTQRLSPDQPVFALQQLEFDRDASRLASLEEIASRYVQDIRTVQPAGPYVLGGFCSGGIIALEIARQLQQQDQEIAHLALLDTVLPPEDSAPLEFDPNDTPWLLAAIAHELTHSPLLGVKQADLQDLDSEAQLRYVLERAQAAEVLPSDLSLGQFRRFVENFRTTLRRQWSYEVHSYPGEITIYASEESVRACQDRSLGWQRVADSRIETIVIPGEHDDLLSPPAVQLLAEHLQQALDASSLALA